MSPIKFTYIPEHERPYKNIQNWKVSGLIQDSTFMINFAPGKVTHLNLATHMTPVCDCFGFTSMPILPDAGVFGSDDIVALDQTTLDIIAQTRLIEENIPTSMEIHTREGHPFQWLHGPLKNPYKVIEYGEKLGLGSREYELEDVLPIVKPERSSMPYFAV